MFESKVTYRNLNDFTVVVISQIMTSDNLINAKLEAIYRSSLQLNSSMEFNLINVECRQVITYLR